MTIFEANYGTDDQLAKNAITSVKATRFRQELNIALGDISEFYLLTKKPQKSPPIFMLIYW